MGRHYICYPQAMITRWTILCILLLAGCVTVTPETVKTMSSEHLCEMLGPGWTSTPGEQKVIRSELLLRKVGCDRGILVELPETSH